MDRKTNKPATINGSRIWAPAVNFGSNDGCANRGTTCNNSGPGQEGDKITPVGKFQITYAKIGILNRDDRDPYDVGSWGDAVRTNDGQYNLGAAAIYLNVGNRGIAFHGSENDTESSTNGCIRMRNADVYLLAQKLQSGMWVVIQN